jgi:hypothetical protein
MAAFMEKFHVSRKEYMFKMPKPMITLMALDSAKVMYGKLKPYTDEDYKEVSEYNRNLTVKKYSLEELIK